MKPDDTGKKQDTRFKPGVSGNPKGRPKGSRSKLSEQFLDALCRDFDEYGVAALKTVRENDPATYVRTAASLIPKEARLEIANDLSRLSDEQLDSKIEALEKSLGLKTVAIDG